MGNQISSDLAFLNEENIKLTNLGLTELPDNVASGLSSSSNLKTLYLQNNKLENLDNFNNDSIDTLHLKQNCFKQLPVNFFSKFPQLKTVYLDCNFLTSLSKQTSETITTLTLSLNNIQTIEVAALKLPQLLNLNLSKNRIKNLPKNFSESFPNLINLDLSYNYIEEIPESSSIFPETLKELNLSHNCIEKVSTTITSLRNLISLKINDNKLTYVPKLNPFIQLFCASDNKISEIESQDLFSLIGINLQNNELTSYPIGIYHPYLEGINLSHNKISRINFSSSIEENQNRNLEFIDLSFNQIEFIPKELFECYPNIQRLFVHFNKISEIPSEISNCEFLKELSISFNPIRNIMSIPRSLVALYASNCLIESFSESSFVEDESDLLLERLFLSGNKIESFSIIPSLKILNLSHNRIVKMPVVTQKIAILDLSMNMIESNVQTMPLGISAPSLIDINLSHNRLTKVPQLLLVPSLRYIEISGNQIEGEINVADFPSLERIDVSETNISVVGESASLHEVITSARADKDEDDSKTVYVNINKSGYSEFLGTRNSMEDSIILRDDLNLFAVLDGHGGPDTAKYGSIEISKLFESKIESSLLKYDNSSQIFLEVFQKVEEGLKMMNFVDGSTLCLAMICKDESGNRKVATAHLGDARALIVRQDGASRELTKDHKPSNRPEFERIHESYGYLSNDNRVDGNLAVSRAIGDFSVYGIGREPDLNEFEIGEMDKYLVICCDGVFDVLSNDDVAKIAMISTSTKEAAFNIRNAAYGCRSADNISVIVVDLND